MASSLTSSGFAVLLAPIDIAWQVGLETGATDQPRYHQSMTRQIRLIEALLKRDAGGYLLGIDVKARRQLTDLLATYTDKFQALEKRP